MPARRPGQNLRNNLLLQHAVEFARHARGEEEAGLADVECEPQAVPIGLSIISAVAGSIACFTLFGGIVRILRVKKDSIRASHSSCRTSSTPAACAATSCDRSSTVGTEAPVYDHGVGPGGGELEGGQQGVAVVTDGGAPVDGQSHVLQLLRHIGEVGVGDLAGQHFVAGADDLDAHGAPL